MEEFRGLSNLINSCRLWGEDGPIMEEIRAVIEGTPANPINVRDPLKQAGTPTQSNGRTQTGDQRSDIMKQ